MNYSVAEIQSLMKADLIQQSNDNCINYLLTDSRKLVFPEATLFFSIAGPRRNGHLFISELYKKGVRNFVVDYSFSNQLQQYPIANFFCVDNVINALQQLARAHRLKFNYPVIGITGSNGKTIIKEWLYQLLNASYKIVRNPKSYNSQIGVPLSIWQMKPDDSLGIFEAGISLPGEMKNLQQLIQPNIGILGFMGDAHAEGFPDFSAKLHEKLILFDECDVLVYCSDDQGVNNVIQQYLSTSNSKLKVFDWSRNHNAILTVETIEKSVLATIISCCYQNQRFNVEIPFTDEASVFNALTCGAVMLCLGNDIALIQQKMNQLKTVAMRLELKKGNNQCAIINDSYSNDIDSLKMALDFLEHQEGNTNKTVILSDLYQAGMSNEELYAAIADLLYQKNIYRFIGIGVDISSQSKKFKAIPHLHFFDSTPDFLNQISSIDFFQETILLKGARSFEFEKISIKLEEKLHDTVLEINLSAVRRNLQRYRNNLNPEVKLMAMVKAFSYGSGSHEIAGILQQESVDYLAVAYADEGVELRKAGIHLPIMVMNASVQNFESLVEYCLEPELYNISILKDFSNFIFNKKIQYFPVHIKLDTGMHRLGFMENELDAACEILSQNSALKVKSVFSHLVASEQPEQDNFTKQQGVSFLNMSGLIEDKIGYQTIKHLCNTTAIKRHPNLQFDMVRLGIGLYGIDHFGKPENVTTLKTTIAQIKIVNKEESVGYGRNAMLERETIVATVRIGYADGYFRSLGNGKGKMYIKGKYAPVIGNVCMDMTMLDISDIPDVREGDEVIVFGEQLPVQEVSVWANTIPYEILTNVSQRVKRVYFEE